MSRHRLPINVCQHPGCVYVGHWPRGDYCPAHEPDPCQHGALECPMCRPHDEPTTEGETP